MLSKKDIHYLKEQCLTLTSRDFSHARHFVVMTLSRGTRQETAR